MLTREQLKLHWEALEAFKNGEELQSQCTTFGLWYDEKNPKFNITDVYRVKPKEETFALGDSVRVTRNGHPAILALVAQVERNIFCLININTGQRWRVPIVFNGEKTAIPKSVLVNEGTKLEKVCVTFSETR